MPSQIEGRLERGGAGLLVEGKMWGASVGCLVDTGATINILSLAWFRRHGKAEAIHPTTETVFSVEGRPMQLHGKVRAAISLGGREWPVEFEVADVATEAILGSSFLRDGRFLVDMAGERLLTQPRRLLLQGWRN